MKIKILKSIIDLFYPLIIIILLFLFKYISFINLICGYLIYCTIVYYTSGGYLIYTKNDFTNNLLKCCPSIRNPNFKAYFILPFTFFQFIIIRYSNKSKLMENIVFEEEKIDDEGTTIIWASFKNDKNIHSKPVLFILPGITGKISDFYVKNIVVEGLNNNFDIAIFQIRTLSDKMKLPKNNKNVNFSEDINNSIKVIQKKNSNKIYAIGYSYGANILSNYLGTKNIETKYIEAAISISNFFDMFLSQREGEGNLYEYIVLKFLKRNFLPAANSVNKEKNNFFDINFLKSCKSIKEFDTGFITKILGYKNGDDYYRKISSYKYIDNINVPLLIINAKDDPFCSFKGIPFDSINENKNIIFIGTEQGAHSCYIENEKYYSIGSKQWILKPIFEFLNFIHSSEYKKNC